MYWEAIRPALFLVGGLVAAALVPGFLSAGLVLPTVLSGLVSVLMFSAGYGGLLD